jgi:polysaccharide pyruvyl transferase WcaK-like protein
MIDIVRLPAKPTLVVGGYGYRNAGDEAILSGLLELAGRDGVTVVSRAPAETAAIHGVRSISLRDAPAAVRHHRGVVIGGGGLFGRDMGLLGKLLPLAGMLASTRAEVALLGIGVDARMPRAAGTLLGALGRRAVSVVVRDQASQLAMREIGVEATVAADLSSRVASAGRESGMRHLEAAGLQPRSRQVIGLSLTAIDPGLISRVEEAVVSAMDALPGTEFCFVPMSRHPSVASHNDEVLARRLQRRRPRLRILVPPDDTRDVLAIFEGLGGAVCMRFHSLLFAERAGIPILAYPYADKCREWLAEHSMTAAHASSETIVGLVQQAMQHANQRASA